jgi:hypothetical protein
MPLIDPFDDVTLTRAELEAAEEAERKKDYDDLLRADELRPPADQEIKSWWEKGVNHAKFNYVLPAFPESEATRNELMTRMLDHIAKEKYIIREESHGFKKGTPSEEAITKEHLPGIWLEHEQQIRTTKFKESPTLLRITRAFWRDLTGIIDDDRRRSVDFLPDSTAIQLLMKIITLNIDAFEEEKEETIVLTHDKKHFTVNSPDRTRLLVLRDLLMFFIFDPIKSTFQSYFTLLKHRAQQFYTHEPFTNYSSASDPRVKIWNESLVRTTAVRTYHTTRAKQAQVVRATDVYFFTFPGLCRTVQDMKPAFLHLGESEDRMDWLIWVLVNTGCRQNEVWSPYYEFYPYPIDPDLDNLVPELQPYRLYFEVNGFRNDPHNWIIQLGSSKDKQKAKEGVRVSENILTGANKSTIKRWIEKPVAFRYPAIAIVQTIIKLRNFARTTWDQKHPSIAYNEATPQQISKIFNPIVNSRMVVRFPDAAAKAKRNAHSFGAHLCRSIYATIAYDFFSAFLPQYSKAAFVAKVLAHDATNLTTAQSYDNVRVEYAIPNRVTLDQKAVFQRVLGELEAVRSKMQGMEKTLGPVQKRWESVPDAAKAPEDVGFKNASVQLPTMTQKEDQPGTNFVNLQRLQAPKKPKDGERIEFVQKAMNFLLDHDVDPTTKNLVAIGCSAGWTTMYRQAMKELKAPTVVEERLGESSKKKKKRKVEQEEKPEDKRPRLSSEEVKDEQVMEDEALEVQSSEEQFQEPFRQWSDEEGERPVEELVRSEDLGAFLPPAPEASELPPIPLTEPRISTPLNLDEQFEALPFDVPFDILPQAEAEEEDERIEEKEAREKEKEKPAASKQGRKARTKHFPVWPFDPEGYIIIPTDPPEVDEREYDDYPGNRWDKGTDRIRQFEDLHPKAFDVKIIVPQYLSGKKKSQRTSQHRYLQTIKEYPPQFLTNAKMCKEELAENAEFGQYVQMNQWLYVGRKPEMWCWKEVDKRKK